jgi:long-subunit acyl-CoA synthetase (AMP-forming)
MPMPLAARTEFNTHLAQVFYNQVMAQRGAPLLWWQSHARLCAVSRGEAAEWISTYIRGLESMRVARGARVGMIGAPDTVRILIFIAHAMMGITTVIAPPQISTNAQVQLLRESHCSTLLVEDGQQALSMLHHAAEMPELQSIIGLKGNIVLPSHHLTTISLDSLLQRGRALPDRTSAMLQLTRKDDAAFIIGLHSTATSTDSPIAGARAMHTHAEILHDCQQLKQLLDEAKILIPYGSPVLVQPQTQNIAAFVATQLLPVVIGGSVDYSNNAENSLENFRMVQPSLLIASSAYIRELQTTLEEQLIEKADIVDRTTAKQLFRLGKKRYEQSGKLNMAESVAFRIAQHSTAPRIRELLGATMQGMLCTDEDLPYGSMVFFDTLGILTAEIPSVFGQTFEKTRL